jgi:hypothetical protein
MPCFSPAARTSREPPTVPRDRGRLGDARASPPGREDRSAAQRAPDRSGRAARSGTLIHSRVSFGNVPCRNVPPKFCVGRPGQRLGPNARGGAERGTGGCRSNDIVRVLLVAGIASGVAGSWFAACGSWSRMRHHRAARGGRRVAVWQRPPTAGAGWRRSRPG